MPEGGATEVWRAARSKFGNRLRSLREATRLTQKVLAKKLDCSDRTVSDLERGIGAEPPRLELVERYVDHCLTVLPTDELVKREQRQAILAARTQLEDLHEQLSDTAPHKRVPPASSVQSLSTLRRDAHAFTGRTDELELVINAAEALGQETRVVAVHAVDGMPGVGKTTFAIHAAHQLADRFPDGQLFIDLHGHSPGGVPVDPNDALASLLTAMGVNPLDLPADLERRAASWRTSLAGRRVLLVIDNAAHHAQIEPLLPGDGRCLVLVTSRRRLVELDAVSIDLNPLDTDEAEEMFRRLAGRPVTEPASLTAVVELCGRLPLAIAILAARFRNRRALTAARLVEELTEAANRLPSLRSGDRAVAAAFDLSYRDLSPERQRFFRLLGLHPGEGMERYSVAALCGLTVDDAAHQLDALYHEHLVDEVILGRYQMHDLLAEYARSLVEHDDLDVAGEALGSLLDFYEQTAGIAGDLLIHGFRGEDVGTWFAGAVPELADDSAAMDWLEQERANLLICLDSTENASRVVGLTLSLTPYLRRTGPWDLALRLHRRAVEAARALGDVEAEGQALLDLGKAEFYADHYDEAQVALRAAGRIFTDSGDTTNLAHTMMVLGQVWMQTSDLPDAHNAFSQALAAHEKDGNRTEIAAVLVELGTLHYFQDNYSDSVAANQRALHIYEQSDDREGQATALKGLSHAWLFSDDYERAHDAAARARDLFREARGRLGEAQTSATLGSVRRTRGQYAHARDEFESALEIYDELGDRAGMAMALIELGIVLYHLDDFPAGEQTLRRAMDLYEEFGELMGMAAVRKELADLLIRAGRLPEAKNLLDEAEALYQKLDDRMGKAMTSNSYGMWHLASGDPRTARSRHNDALRLALEIPSPLEQASALTGLGRVARALGEHAAAEQAFKDALAIYQCIGAGEAAELARELGLD